MHIFISYFYYTTFTPPPQVLIKVKKSKHAENLYQNGIINNHLLCNRSKCPQKWAAHIISKHAQVSTKVDRYLIIIYGFAPSRHAQVF